MEKGEGGEREREQCAKETIRYHPYSHIVSPSPWKGHSRPRKVTFDTHSFPLVIYRSMNGYLQLPFFSSVTR